MRVPLPEPILRFLVLIALMNGFISQPLQAAEWITLAVALLTGSHGLMRPGEIVAPTRRMVILPGDSWLGFNEKAVIAVERPKNRRHAARQQFHVIEDERAVAWLSWYCAGLPAFVRLFAISRLRFKNLFRELLGQVGLSSAKFTLASLRAGGATHMFMMGCDISRLKFLGGWRSINSLEHYVQEAATATILARIPPHVQKQIKSALLLFPGVPPPPIQPWSAFFSRAAHTAACARAQHDVEPGWLLPEGGQAHVGGRQLRDIRDGPSEPRRGRGDRPAPRREEGRAGGLLQSSAGIAAPGRLLGPHDRPTAAPRG